MPHLRLGAACTLFAAILSTGAAAAPATTITTVAGAGATFPEPGGWSGDGGLASAAELSRPAQVVSERGGSYLIVDSANHRIRRVSTAGRIKTVAGNGVQGFCGDGGKATDACLNLPHDVAPLPNGGFLIADTFNRRVRYVAPSGVISTVAGNGSPCTDTGTLCGHGRKATRAALTLPDAVSVSPLGGFFVADQHSHTVRLVHAGVMLTLVGDGQRGARGDGRAAVNARLSDPADVEPRPAGGFVISDGSNCRIRVVSRRGRIDPVAGAPRRPHCPRPSGLQPPAPAAGPALKVALNGPGYLALAANGTIIFTDVFGNRLRALLPNGRVETLAGGNQALGFSGDGGPASKAQLAWPSGVALRPGGAVLFTDAGNNRVRLIQSDWEPARVRARGYSIGVRPLAIPRPDAQLRVAAGRIEVPIRCPVDPRDRPCVGSVRLPGSRARSDQRGARTRYTLRAGRSQDIVVQAPAGRCAAASTRIRLAVSTRQPNGRPGRWSGAAELVRRCGR